MASIDKRPNRPNSPWRARWREYPGGPQLTQHFARKVDAERHLAEVTVALARGVYLSPDDQRVTLGAYADTYRGRQVWRPRTHELAEWALEQVTDRLGRDRPLSSIRPGDVESLVVSLRAVYEPHTVRNIFNRMHTMMRAAQRDGLIAIDPMLGIKLPAVPASELVVPAPGQVHELLAAAPPTFSAAVVLGAMVGLRAGEAQGLLVDDVDFLRRTVNVRRQLQGKSLAKAALVEPKTPSSVRAVPVPTEVLELLAAHIERHGRGPDGVLLHHRGHWMAMATFANLWDQTQRRAGLAKKSLRFHWLRHAFASSLISAGCSVKAVSVAMGHASPAITLKVYGHLWPGDEDRIREAIARVWHAEDPLRTTAVAAVAP